MPIFFELFFSPSRVPLSPVFPRLEPRARCLAAPVEEPAPLGPALHDGHYVGSTRWFTSFTTGPASPRNALGGHCRFYDTAWEQEGAHDLAGALIRPQPGTGVNAAARGSHWLTPGRDVERGAGQNVSRLPVQTLRMARTHGE
jgi:hypothetical protein